MRRAQFNVDFFRFPSKMTSFSRPSWRWRWWWWSVVIVASTSVWARIRNGMYFIQIKEKDIDFEIYISIWVYSIRRIFFVSTLGVDGGHGAPFLFLRSNHGWYMTNKKLILTNNRLGREKTLFSDTKRSVTLTLTLSMPFIVECFDVLMLYHFVNTPFRFVPFSSVQLSSVRFVLFCFVCVNNLHYTKWFP